LRPVPPMSMASVLSNADLVAPVLAVRRLVALAGELFRGCAVARAFLADEAFLVVPAVLVALVATAAP
jgi:hypothetical protein